MSGQHKQASLPYNIAVYGAEGLGKSAFIERFISGQFSQEKCAKKLQATLPFNTTHGKVKFFVKEFASGVIDAVPPHIHGAIVFVDDGAEIACKIAKVLGDIPVVFIISKIDSGIDKVLLQNTVLSIKSQFYSHKVYSISSLSQMAIGHPFLYLARIIKEDDQLTFI